MFYALFLISSILHCASEPTSIIDATSAEEPNEAVALVTQTLNTSYDDLPRTLAEFDDDALSTNPYITSATPLAPAYSHIDQDAPPQSIRPIEMKDASSDGPPSEDS